MHIPMIYNDNSVLFVVVSKENWRRPVQNDDYEACSAIDSCLECTLATNTSVSVWNTVIGRYYCCFLPISSVSDAHARLYLTSSYMLHNIVSSRSLTHFYHDHYNTMLPKYHTSWKCLFTSPQQPRMSSSS